MSARRRSSRSVQEAREKLAYKNGFKPEFDYDLLLMFVKNELAAALTTPLLAIIVAMGMMFWAPVQPLIYWLVMVFISKGILLSLCRQFSKIPKEKAKPNVWRAKITAAEFLYGVCWASVVFINADTQSESAHTFIFASVLVVISMRMLFASTNMSIVYAGTLPMTAALVIRFALLDNPFYWAMAAMAVGVHIYFIWLMNGVNGTVLAMLEFRAEKDALIAELEQSKSISDDARSRAEEANIAKSRFLATMSHELRTPLNAILGFSEIMRAEILGPHSNPTYKEYANDIHHSGQHLLNLINEVLDISRIESGRYQLHESSVALADIAADCRRLMHVRAENKGLKIVEDFEPDLQNLWADERAMRQICLNLISNAIKFTPSGGTVTLAVHRTEDGGQVLKVKDTGPGIPEHEIPRVLQSFGQGSLAHETAEGGTGLGLPITRGLAELHDGKFDLKSKLRYGTEVIVTFPPKRIAEALPRIAEPGETGEAEETPQTSQQKNRPWLWQQATKRSA
ncbi:HAMP domain-containing sensor histidine kinase [Methyloligella sp. 2.7D]|uniref:sensor histidine kinase n=1 Tax=unclassified Methyloligella TaxID=2625955 RepID=UPI001FEDF7BB|nr:HAMP domain-containing sensor histidine kinase [Methyloligella sp. GL2]